MLVEAKVSVLGSWFFVRGSGSWFGVPVQGSSFKTFRPRSRFHFCERLQPEPSSQEPEPRAEPRTPNLNAERRTTNPEPTRLSVSAPAPYPSSRPWIR